MSPAALPATLASTMAKKKVAKPRKAPKATADQRPLKDDELAKVSGGAGTPSYATGKYGVKR